MKRSSKSTVTKTTPKAAPREAKAPAAHDWTQAEVLEVAHAAGLPATKIAEFSRLPIPEGAADYKWLLRRVVDAIRYAGRSEGYSAGFEVANRKVFDRSNVLAWEAAHERGVGDLVAGALAADLLTKNASAGLLDLVQMLLGVLNVAEEVDGGLDPKLSLLVRHRIQMLAEHGGQLAARVDAARSGKAEAAE